MMMYTEMQDAIIELEEKMEQLKASIAYINSDENATPNQYRRAAGYANELAAGLEKLEFMYSELDYTLA